MPIWLAAWGRYNAGAGAGWACAAALTACSTLEYTEKTSIRPVISRTRQTKTVVHFADKQLVPSQPLRQTHLEWHINEPEEVQELLAA